MVEYKEEDSNVLQAMVSGGLNTVSSALNRPREDAPDLLNVDITIDGIVTKRRGGRYQEFFTFSSDSRIDAIVNVTLKNGKALYVYKSGNTLKFTHCDDSKQCTTLTRLNVWSDRAKTVTGDAHVSYETFYTRVIFMTGLNVPIQACIVEGSIEASGFSGTGLNGYLPSQFTDASAANMFAWAYNVNTQQTIFTTVNAFTYGASSSSITIGSSLASGDWRVHLIWCSWQWWAEASKVEGDQIVQTVNIAAGQRHIATPARMLSAIFEVADRLYPIKLYKNGDYNSDYTLFAFPATENDYRWDTGHNSPGANQFIPSPYFASFGAGAATAKTAIFHRGHYIPFIGGNGVRGDYLKVAATTNTQTFTQYTVRSPNEGGAGTGGVKYSYYLRGGTAGSYVSNTAVTDNSRYISFDATATANGGLGIPQDDTYVFGVFDPAPLKAGASANNFVGSNATARAATYTGLASNNYIRDTGAFPVFGLHNYCNYLTGSFPRCVTVVQGRLVLGGMIEQPNVLGFSSVNDNVLPGRFYDNYQIALEQGLPTDSFDVVLNANRDDTVMCMREFQGNLFVFTRHRTYRILGADGVLQASNAVVTTVAEVGCANAQSAVITQNSVYFLHSTGLFAVQPTDAADGYRVIEISLKVRNLFRMRRIDMEGLAWVTYDSFDNRVYIGLPDYQSGHVCAELFVYHELREAWTKYSDGSGLYFFTNGGFAATHSANDVRVYFWLNAFPFTDIGVPAGYVMEMKQDDIYIDVFAGNNGSLPVFDIRTRKEVRFTTTDGVYEYDPAVRPSDITLNFHRFFKPSRYQDIEDIRVQYDGQLLEFQRDFFKSETGSIILNFNPTSGKLLTVFQVMKINGVKYRPYVGMMSLNNLASNVIVPTTETSGLFVFNYNNMLGFSWDLDASLPYNEQGYCYPTYHVSPLISMASLHNWKRIKNFTGFYANLSAKYTQNVVGTRYDLVGLRRHYVQFDLVFVFSDELSGYVSEEVYGNSELTWDTSHLSSGTVPDQRKFLDRTIVPVIGGGYDFQFIHYHMGAGFFSLYGYQIDAVMKRGKGTSRQQT